MRDATHDEVARSAAVASSKPAGPTRVVPTVLFAVALLAFLLPFGTVSCGTPVSFTGVELATGTVTGDDATIVDQVNSTAPLPALFALLCSASGLALAIAGMRGQGTTAVAGLLALLLLPWLSGLAELDVHGGYFLAVAALAGVGGWRCRILIRRWRRARLRVWPAWTGLVALMIVACLTLAFCVAASASFGTTG
jgi:hypothetical protein